MHAAEREHLILKLLAERGFIGFQELDRQMEASPATIRRDLERLSSDGKIERVRGGARHVGEGALRTPDLHSLTGVPFHENVSLFTKEKAAIGRVAAGMCAAGEAVIIDGGSTTLQMCPHLEPLGLQVLTNSLHIVSALLSQPNTRISLPAGTIFREQNIVLSPFDDDGTSRYHASKLFMGAASIGRRGLMQADTLLVQAERRLFDRADEIIVLVDASKFSTSAGHLVFALEDIDVLITDDRITDIEAAMIEQNGCKLLVASLAPVTMKS